MAVFDNYARIAFIAFDFHNQCFLRNSRDWAIVTSNTIYNGHCWGTNWIKIQNILLDCNVTILYVRGFKEYKYVQYLFPELDVRQVRGIKLKYDRIYCDELKRVSASKKAKEFRRKFISTFSFSR